jgi:hypothetical protein
VLDVRIIEYRVPGMALWIDGSRDDELKIPVVIMVVLLGLPLWLFRFGD